MANPPASYDVFISYSRLDTAVADQICAELERAGLTYFIDRQGIKTGMEFPERLAQAIMDSAIFLYLGSANSYQSKFTNAEITFAFNKKERNRIIPYLIDSTPLPIGLEFTFSAINWRTLTSHPVNKLVDDILDNLGKKRPATTPKESPSNPNDASVSPTQIRLWIQKAKECYNKFDKAGGFVWYMKAARAGDPEAQFRVGFAQIYGNLGAEKNQDEGKAWLTKAGENGNPDAQYELGYLYHNFGNKEMAKYWLKRACESKEPRAPRLLGDIYRGEKVYTKAYLCYMKCSSALTHWHRAQMREFGKGVEENLADALKQYQDILFFHETKINGYVMMDYPATEDRIKNKISQLKKVLAARKIGVKLSHGEYEG